MPLKIVIPDAELWDKKNNRFVYVKGQTLMLEHSLVSVSKWESKWHKPFLSKDKKTVEETIDYIRCMTLTQNVDPEVYKYLTNNNIEQVDAYIEDSMSATWFGKEDNTPKGGRKIITSEVIYYWMVALQIPFECQKWHLNRLITLIKICNEENKPKKKLSGKELYKRNASLNAARKAAMNSLG